jgi:hypothetical protein
VPAQIVMARHQSQKYVVVFYNQKSAYNGSGRSQDGDRYRPAIGDTLEDHGRCNGAKLH